MLIMLNGFCLSSNPPTPPVLNGRYQVGCNVKQSQVKIIFSFYIVLQVLILFRMGLFTAAHRWGERQKEPPTPPPHSPFLKSTTHILHWWNLTQSYLTWRRSEKYINHMTNFWILLTSAFFSENQQFLVYQV